MEGILLRRHRVHLPRNKLCHWDKVVANTLESLMCGCPVEAGGHAAGARRSNTPHATGKPLNPSGWTSFWESLKDPKP